jgi:hypothetical protein
MTRRTSKDGERLNDEEASDVVRGVCSDCAAELLEGPHGGLSINVKCSSPTCGSRFNICGPGGALGVERISDAQPHKPSTLKELLESDPDIMTAREAAARGISPEQGMYTTSEAAGAWANGTEIVKAISEMGDSHSVGARGVVVGSLGPIKGEYGYFVRWAEERGVVFVRGSKLRLR